MRILFSLIALFGVIAIADIGLSPSANATVITTGIHALKAEQAGVAEKAGTRCWWRDGRRHCVWVGPRRDLRCVWRNGRRICPRAILRR
jgi:hypothetical protein